MLLPLNAYGLTFPDPSSGAYPGATPLDGYFLYTGTMVMMLVGFGYLMTFLKWYGLGAVGFCLLITGIGMQWSVFIEAFFSQMYNNTWGPVALDIFTLMNICTVIATPLISFGAVIGKVTPLQLFVMLMLELAARAFTYNIILKGMLNVSDIGGIHSNRISIYA